MALRLHYRSPAQAQQNERQDNIVKIIAIGALLMGLIGLQADSALANIIDTRTFSGAQCDGTATGCFGFTLSLTVDDLGNLADGTYRATVNILGTYSGVGMTHIGAVDIKVGDVVAPVSLTTAPLTGGGAITDWTTLFTSGQAAGNCLDGAGGFLCSYDTGTNTLAPINNGAVNYTWIWDFNLSGAYSFSHLGANLTVANDGAGGSCNSPNAPALDCLSDGQNISIDSGGTTTKVAEPSAFLLLGAGMLALRRFLKR